MILYALTIALGAFLLFLVEPMSARLLLPLFGGAASVWLASLLFFQLALLAGYLFADAAVTRLKARSHALAHLALLALATLSLPLNAAPALPGWLAPAPPTVQLLVLLARSVGVPFLALAATGPIVQALWSRHRQGSPYRLYALGNLASLLGLACYPFLVEPLFTLHAQARLFSAAFLLFALAAAALALRGLNSHAPDDVDSRLDVSIDDSPSRDLDPAGKLDISPAPELDISNSRRSTSLWLLLPLCSSALLLSVTGHLTRNVAPIPLLWMAPLAAYLLSFILCFETPRWLTRKLWAPLSLLALALLAAADGWIPPESHLGWSIAGITLAFFVAVTGLHGELVRLRPPAQQLTRFYLSLSLGSALGSLLVAALVPLLFDGLVELSLTLVATALLLCFSFWPAIRAWSRHSISTRGALLLFVAVLALSLFLTEKTRARGDVFAGRNFYGALHVQEQIGKHGRVRMLFNGTTIHGLQRVEPALSAEVLAYYGKGSGLSRALLALHARGRPLRVGVIGLGAGMVAGDCRSGDRFVFYEINPLVVRVAREQFTFLAGCAGAEVRLGDARLLLAKEPADEQYDLLVLDAFNSDSVPVHLVTAEAFALYAGHLAPDGVIAAHASNRYLNLEPALAAHAPPLGMDGILVEERAATDDIFPNLWLLMSRDPKSLGGEAFLGAAYQPLAELKPVREWTDDYSNLAGAFR